MASVIMLSDVVPTNTLAYYTKAYIGTYLRVVARGEDRKGWSCLGL